MFIVKEGGIMGDEAMTTERPAEIRIGNSTGKRCLRGRGGGAMLTAGAITSGGVGVET